jgi:uncharacterized damage-inducible protein DinB
MAATANPTPSIQSPKQSFLDAYVREHATTLRVLRAYPEDRAELTPHRLCKSARELAFIFVTEQALMETALTTGFDWSKPPSESRTPATIREIADLFDAGHQRIAGILRAMPDEKLHTTVQFFTGPKTLGDVPLSAFLWLMLHDQIHHRGQFSIYLRMADAKVPSIYGPTADEPWV